MALTTYQPPGVRCEVNASIQSLKRRPASDVSSCVPPTVPLLALCLSGSTLLEFVPKVQSKEMADVSSVTDGADDDDDAAARAHATTDAPSDILAF